MTLSGLDFRYKSSKMISIPEIISLVGLFCPSSTNAKTQTEKTESSGRSYVWNLQFSSFTWPLRLEAVLSISVAPRWIFEESRLAVKNPLWVMMPPGSNLPVTSHSCFPSDKAWKDCALCKTQADQWFWENTILILKLSAQKRQTCPAEPQHGTRTAQEAV